MDRPRRHGPAAPLAEGSQRSKGSKKQRREWILDHGWTRIRIAFIRDIRVIRGSFSSPSSRLFPTAHRSERPVLRHGQRRGDPRRLADDAPGGAFDGEGDVEAAPAPDILARPHNPPARSPNPLGRASGAFSRRTGRTDRRASPADSRGCRRATDRTRSAHALNRSSIFRVAWKGLTLRWTGTGAAPGKTEGATGTAMGMATVRVLRVRPMAALPARSVTWPS